MRSYVPTITAARSRALLRVTMRLLHDGLMKTHCREIALRCTSVIFGESDAAPLHSTAGPDTRGLVDGYLGSRVPAQLARDPSTIVMSAHELQTCAMPPAEWSNMGHDGHDAKFCECISRPAR